MLSPLSSGRKARESGVPAGLGPPCPARLYRTRFDSSRLAGCTCYRRATAALQPCHSRADKTCRDSTERSTPRRYGARGAAAAASATPSNATLARRAAPASTAWLTARQQAQRQWRRRRRGEELGAPAAARAAPIGTSRSAPSRPAHLHPALPPPHRDCGPVPGGAAGACGTRTERHPPGYHLTERTNGLELLL